MSARTMPHSLAAIEDRLRHLTSRYREGDRSPSLVEEVEVLASAAFVDPQAPLADGPYRLSQALARSITSSELKRTFNVENYACDVDHVYQLARRVVGHDLARDMLDDVLVETGQPDECFMLVVSRIVDPASRYRAAAASRFAA